MTEPSLDITVSIHASAREATSGFRVWRTFALVSIHASAREATCKWLYSHPRLGVSIHASAREATAGQSVRTGGAGVSIHASAREATLDILQVGCFCQCFNPRLREGGDVAGDDVTVGSGSFNPRLREGGDWCLTVLPSLID